MESAEALARWAEAARWRHLAIESAGVFWLAAEMVILLLVLWGREHLARTPTSTTLHLTPRIRDYALGLGLLALALTALVIGRFLWAATPALSVADACQRELHHILLWAAFVTGWVLYEILIVYHGVRGYQRLRRLLGGAPSPPTRVPAALVLFLLLPAIASCAIAQPLAFETELTPYRNALYFYLRVAGLVWIAVEWVAVFVLFRTWRLLHAAGPTP